MGTIKKSILMIIILSIQGCGLPSIQHVFIENQTTKDLSVRTLIQNEYGKQELEMAIAANGGSNGWQYETYKPEIIDEGLVGLIVQSEEHECVIKLSRDEVISLAKKQGTWNIILVEETVNCD